MSLTQAEVRHLFQYAPETGELRWRNPTARNVKAGDLTGHRSTGGYLRINLRWRYYSLHRLAWLYMTGAWPTMIDHINQNPADNRWCNLREATYSQNNHNRAFPGVTFDRTRGLYKAQITLGGRRKNLGRFQTWEAARAVYLSEKAGSKKS